MKTSARGIVAAAILMIVAGVGFGIAQAGEYPSDRPALTVHDQEALEQYKDFLAGPVETGNLPEATQTAQAPASDAIAENSEGQEIPQKPTSQQEMVPEGNGSGNDWQVRGPIETGSLRDSSEVNDLDHSNVPMEGNVSQYWGSDNPSN
jgi:hypothetical protein